MPSAGNSTQRRHKTADRRYRLAPYTMRPCKSCVARGVACRIGKEHLECEQCYRFNRKCDLAPDYKEMDKALRNVEELDDQILEMRIKLARVEKQRRFWLKRMKDLGDKESANILEIEADEAIEDPPNVSTGSPPVALVDFSSAQVDELLGWPSSVSSISEAVPHS